MRAQLIGLNSHQKQQTFTSQVKVFGKLTNRANIEKLFVKNPEKWEAKINFLQKIMQIISPKSNLNFRHNHWGDGVDLNAYYKDGPISPIDSPYVPIPQNASKLGLVTRTLYLLTSLRIKTLCKNGLFLYN